MCDLKMFEDTPESISSPELEAGNSPCNSPAGQQTDLFGLVPAPAKTIPLPEKAKDTAVRVISGPKCSGSSASVALSAALASRLKQQLATVGSMVYRQTWKEKTTPSGRLYWAHTASAKTTEDNGLFGWPTPNTPTGGANTKRHERGAGGADLDEMALTLRDFSPNLMKGPHRGVNDTLNSASRSAPWPTPNATEGPNNSRKRENGQTRNRDTPQNIPDNGSTSRFIDGKARLEDQVMGLAGWVSPTAQDHSRGDKPQYNRNSLPLNCEVTLCGSNAPTENRGALNPAFSLWLMGFLTDEQTPSWNTSSPNWKEWATVQSLLGRLSDGPATTALEDYQAQETPSYPTQSLDS